MRLIFRQHGHDENSVGQCLLPDSTDGTKSPASSVRTQEKGADKQ